MNATKNVATLALITALAAPLAACGSSDDPARDVPSGGSDTSTTTPSPAATSTPSDDASPDAVTAISGQWEAPEAEWIVTFKDDGTFSEDFQGVTDFRSGTYEVENDTVRLIGGDGNTDEGEISGSGDDTQIAFKLGTLKRQ